MQNPDLNLHRSVLYEGLNASPATACLFYCTAISLLSAECTLLQGPRAPKGQLPIDSLDADSDVSKPRLHPSSGGSYRNSHQRVRREGCRSALTGIGRDLDFLDVSVGCRVPLVVPRPGIASREVDR